MEEAVEFQPTPAPPVAKRVPQATTLHGETRVDDYAWLRNKEDAEVVAYLEAENAYADGILLPTKDLRENLYKEMLSRIKETDLSVPYRKGGHFYYSRTEQGKQYAIHCRKRGGLEAPEEIVLEMNAMAQGEKFLALGAYEVSDDGNLLAFSTDVTGFRQYTLQVKDLRTGEILPDRVERVAAVAWAADPATLYYVVEDDAKRPYRLYRHRLGSAAHDLLYEETDERFFLDVDRTRSGEYLFAHSVSKTTTEVRVLRADDTAGSFQLVRPRTAEHEYYLEHHREHFYIRTNDAGKNFRLARVPVAAPGGPWEEVVPHRPQVMLEGAMAFTRHLVLLEREGGLPHLSVLEVASRASHRIPFPEPAYHTGPEQNRTFDTAVFRYAYTSLVTPPSVYDYDMDARTASLLKRREVLGGYDASRYEVERLQATAADGTSIPISLVFRKGIARDGSNPLYLGGYGSYGIPLPVTFDSNRFSLIDRGVVLAYAHVRGGGELGKAWHDQGRMRNKKNTFTDFIAAAEHLVHEGYTSPDRLVIAGGSAGGLLMGAVVNLRPDLFHAVLAQVPFVDVINTMLDTSLPLTVTEYEEWGNPNLPEEYANLRTYSPYDNLEAKAYPAMLVRTSLNDSQVMYWEPAKYVAKLRTLKTDSNPLLLVTNLAAGHGGSSGRYDLLREIALNYAWILTEMHLAP